MAKRISLADWGNLPAPSQQHFMQTAAWGNFKELCGISTECQVNTSENIGAVVQGIRHTRFPWHSWYIPFGPVQFSPEKRPSLHKFIDNLSQEAKKYGAFCLDIEPEDSLWTPILEELDFKACPSSLQPSHTVIIDLHKTEDELLSAMKPKTRYNVRLAEKKEVVINKRLDNSLEKFWELLQETAERNEVTFYKRSYFEHLKKALGENLHCLEASYNGEIIASLLLVLSGKTATYLFGASANAYRNTMANYLLHWQAMLHAKELGYATYDFWGISDGTAHTARWEGITRFKTSWGGEEIAYPGLYRKVLSPVKMMMFSAAKRVLGK